MLVYAFNWKNLSISAALGYRWDGKRCRQWFQTQPGSYNDKRLIEFLCDLKKHMRGQKVILIWDGLPAHKSRKMKQYLESQRVWLQIETLPGYSPDLIRRKTCGATSKVRSWPTAVLPGSARPKPACAAAWSECAYPSCRFLSCTTRGSFFDLSCHHIIRDSVGKPLRQQQSFGA